MTMLGEHQSRSLKDRCQGITWLVLDVDGVLTGGDIAYGEPRSEIKAFHVRDGSGLKQWHRAGHRSAIITGRSSPVVERRAAELGIARVYQGASDKLQAFQALLAEYEIAANAICYVGDDSPDVPVLSRAGLAVAVADGCAAARAVAHYQTAAPGGRGAVREIIERILRCQGTMPDAAT